jgi:hypothetical protein
MYEYYLLVVWNLENENVFMIHYGVKDESGVVVPLPHE